VEQQRRRIEHAQLHQPLAQRPGGLLRQHRVLAEEATRLAEVDREAQPDLEHGVGVVDVVAVVAVGLLHAQAGQGLEPGVAQVERLAGAISRS
jgi:hypothetical protein